MPLIPGLSIFINIYLMLMLDGATWIRFLVWMVVGKFQIVTLCVSRLLNSKKSSGFIIYFAYGIWQSEENVGKGRLSVIYAHTNLAFEDDEEKNKRKRSD